MWRGCLKVWIAGVVVALVLSFWGLHWARIAAFEEELAAARQGHADALAVSRQIGEEAEELRAMCNNPKATASGGVAALGVETASVSNCEARSYYAPAGFPLAEMAFVRDHLVRRHGWHEARSSDTAAFVLASADAPPVKTPCGEDFEGIRIPGTFARELEVCQKHKLFERLTELFAGGRGARDEATPEALAKVWPWLPRTYLLEWPTHLAALNATLPCSGKQDSFIVKGDAHGGRAVWLPDTNEELRALVGQPCPGAPAAAVEQPEYPPRLVQEMIKSMLWDGASIMGRVFFVVQRRGRTRLSAKDGRWSLGFPAPSYEFHLFDTPLFTQYPGKVRDSAAEEEVKRRNASEVTSFVVAEAARRGREIDRDWVRTYFMPRAAEIVAESFAASGTPWPWHQGVGRGGDPSDALKAMTLEPDGAFLFVASEFMVDDDFQVRLIEHTCVPADIIGIEEHFDALPWTREFAEDLGVQLAYLLLKNTGQDTGGTLEGGIGRWMKLGDRGPFPHP